VSIAGKITGPGVLHRHTAGGRNASGDYDAPTFTDEPVYVEAQQLARAEDRGGAVTTVGTWVALLRPDVADLTGDDEVTVGGRLVDGETVGGTRYAFQGDPWHVRHPRTGRATHWEATLRVVS
jgi:hypothetical protein